MKKLLAFALVAGMLVGCGKKDTFTKVGVGSVTSYSLHYGADEVVTVVAAIALDKDDKIVYAYIDEAQSALAVAADGTKSLKKDQSKKELLEGYGMKETSGKAGIGKEWYEQVKALEDWLVGKTVAEAVADAKIEDGYATDADLLAGCTIAVSGHFAALEEAAKNVHEVSGATKLGLGIKSAYAVSRGNDQVNTTWSVVAVDDKDVVKFIYNDVDQSTLVVAADGTKSLSTALSKKELKEGYNMKDSSGIGKEWYEQQEALEEFMTGKTVAEAVTAAAVAENLVTDADLLAKVTIKVSDYFAAAEEAASKVAVVK